MDRICPSADDCDDDFGGCWARLDGGGWLAYEKLTKCVAIKPAPALLSPPPKPTSVTVKPTPVAPLPVIPLPTQAPLAAFGGKSLQFIDKEALTWGGCRDACKQRFNGDLVSIANSAQNDVCVMAICVHIHANIYIQTLCEGHMGICMCV